MPFTHAQMLAKMPFGLRGRSRSDNDSYSPIVGFTFVLLTVVVVFVGFGVVVVVFTTAVVVLVFVVFFTTVVFFKVTLAKYCTLLPVLVGMMNEFNFNKLRSSRARYRAAWCLSSAVRPVISNCFLPLFSKSLMYAADPDRFALQGVGFRSSCAAARFSQGDPMMIAS